MSEEKIIKHSEKAVHIMMDKDMTWKKKIKEIALEILIIVFAVSITLMFHNWNDIRNEHKIEREFLTGIKEDLKGEAENLDANVKSFQPTVDYYDSVLRQIKTNSIDTNYIDENSGQLLNTAYYVLDNGRFEGFKSSGYLRMIRNQQLLKELMTLYTVSMPFQETIDKNLFAQRSKDYDNYIGIKAVTDTSKVYVSRLLKDPAVQYQFTRYVGSFNERKLQQQQLAKNIRDVIAEIDKELNK